MINTLDAATPLLRSETSGHARIVSRFQHAATAAIVIALSLIAVHQIIQATRTPGDIVRADLVAAAEALYALPATATSDRVLGAVASSLRDPRATVDPSGFPLVVTVTLHGLDRDACAAMARAARRITGLVVVQLEETEFPAACGAQNDLTWRLLP